MADEGMIYSPPLGGAPFRQCEILSDLVQTMLAETSVGKSNDVAVNRLSHPWAITLTQDCDLDWDFKARKGGEVAGDKMIPGVLFGEVSTAEAARKVVASDIWRRIQQNKDVRYHFLEKVPGPAEALGLGVPELVIDFKRYFTIPAPELYLLVEMGQAKRRCRIQSPYLEHLSSRFAHFSSRVALPEDHKGEK